ncbi:MAG TPA: ABC transporter ATP-binding protein [Porphyromonadaceae bacterium]|mgnify:FL=1|nr:ABC transporter ATP-binding protein [Porphyromonadaceae bacterium]HBL33485.1 ABC transporter ATP-binding protein [Porphyromonadaceae bacterium]HBX19059.1 ABC transporter ATP-binding protein [Porphyromonadaceae bacterium]HCM22684.1 ABC transporter ATP-binding protein [Porphyromonadaceae bacterium]
MLRLQNISFILPDKDVLFQGLNLVVNRYQKTALIGNNGVGKSTLLKIIAKELQPSDGQVTTDNHPYYVPQIFGQFNHLSVAQALGIEEKLNALKAILSGNASQRYFDALRDDWTIEERCKEALSYWHLNESTLTKKMDTLSGGEKTKVFLAGIVVHQPELILLDEPTNHLDTSGRQLLYDFIQSTKSTLLIVSHDRKLLNHLDTVCEMNPNGIKVYGGNYDFYKAQKQIEMNALNQDIHSKEKALKKAKEKERETIERQQKLDVRAKKNAGKGGLPKIVANTWKNSAEKSTAKIADIHADKIENVRQALHGLRSSLSETNQIKFGFDNSKLHKGKNLVIAENINFNYENEQSLWNENLNFQIVSGERIAMKGRNGSGKTTLIQLITGKLEPSVGTVYRAANQSVYIDQEYSLLDNRLNVYEQAQRFNASMLQEHEIKTRLNRFLFTREDWEKACVVLSGGEKMRLMICCLHIQSQAPDIIILDEPTNNLDIQSIEILTAALNEYEGTLIVVSHDESFLQQIHINRTIEMGR